MLNRPCIVAIASPGRTRPAQSTHLRRQLVQQLRPQALYDRAHFLGDHSRHRVVQDAAVRFVANPPASSPCRPRCEAHRGSVASHSCVGHAARRGFSSASSFATTTSRVEWKFRVMPCGRSQRGLTSRRPLTSGSSSRSCSHQTRRSSASRARRFPHGPVPLRFASEPSELLDSARCADASVGGPCPDDPFERRFPRPPRATSAMDRASSSWSRALPITPCTCSRPRAWSQAGTPAPRG